MEAMDNDTTQPNTTAVTITVDVAWLERLNAETARELAPTLVYITLLMLAGVVGNTVVLLVYYRRFKPSATRSFVLAMSVLDLTGNVLSLPSEIYDIRYSFSFDNAALCRAMRFVNSFLTMSSAFLLVGVALDRYSKICQPISKQHSLRRTSVTIATCCAVSVSLTVPFTVLNGRHTLHTGRDNQTGITCSIDDRYVHTLFPMAYNLIMALSFVICVTIMMVSYTRIARQLWAHKQTISAGVGSRGQGVVGSGLASSGGWREASSHKDDTTSDAHEVSVSSELQLSSAGEAVPLSAVANTALTTTARVTSHSASLSDNNTLMNHVTLTSATDTHPIVLHDSCVSGVFGSAPVTSLDVPHHVQVTPSDHGVNPAVDDSSFTALVCAASSIVGSTDDSMDKGGNDPSTVHPPRVDSLGYLVPITADSAVGCMHDSADTAGALAVDKCRKPSERSARQGQDQRPIPLLHTVLSRCSKGHTAPSSASTTTTTSSKTRRLTVKKIPSSTTFMMFVLTAIFIINYLPHLIIISTRAAADGVFSGLRGWRLNAYNIGLRSYFINCAVNCIVYGFCSARFRQQCRRFFSRRVL